jgi:hypothetical protein
MFSYDGIEEGGIINKEIHSEIDLCFIRSLNLFTTAIPKTHSQRSHTSSQILQQCQTSTLKRLPTLPLGVVAESSAHAFLVKDLPPLKA